MANKASAVVSLTVILVSMLDITLGSQRIKASATIYIRSDGRIDPPTMSILSLDNVTYTFTDNIYGSIVIERDNIVVNGAGYALQGMGIGGSKGILLTGRNNITVLNMKISSFDYGIYLHESTNTKILESDIANNWDGVYLMFSSNNRVIGNDIIENSDDGIGLYRSTDNIIVGNQIVNNNWRGIWLYNASNHNQISGNNIAANKEEDGVWLGNSSYNFIVGNSITANNDDGILLAWSSNYNNIVGNNIANNKYGIYVLNSSNNSIYHNNFSTNTKQVHSENSNNLWSSYPSGGNYWSDYSGVDMMSGPYQNETGNDGIGDTPYAISEGDADQYPQIDPWFPPIHDISIVEVKPSSNRIYAGQIVDIKATIRNEGRETETFEILGHCEDSRIGTVSISDLIPWRQIVVTLKFDTILLAPRRNYVISVEAKPVDGEEILENNAKTITVKVNLMGDINGDNSVNILDVSIGARGFGTEPGHERWNPDADLNLDNKINVIDITIVAKEFGKSV